MDVPPKTCPWEMPVLPITGRTWPPGAETSIHNSVRAARAFPKLLRCLFSYPRLTAMVLSPSQFRYQAASLSALHRLARLARTSKQYNVLHAHFGPVGNTFRFARELWHAPLMVSFHGYDFCTLPRKEGAGMYRQLFETADAITVNSEFTRRQVERLRCPPVKLHKIPVGLNPVEFCFRERTHKPNETIRILSVGRLVEIKGNEFAIRAVAKIREASPSIRYDIVGDGPLRKKLEELSARLVLQEIAVLHGALNGTEVRRLMDDAHLFLLASVNVEGDQEGQGLVLQAAQDCG